MSARPLYINDRSESGWMDKSIYISAHDGRIIAKSYGRDAKDIALLFVRAVNSHEALLEAAKRLINDIDNGDGIAGQSIDDMKEAIAQAEVKP